jgi:stage V sporulation protein B
MTEAGPARKFGVDVGWVLVSTTVALLAGFLIRPLLARWLGASGLGLYSLAITILGMGLLLANFGVSQSLLKYVAEDTANRDRTARIVMSGFSMSIVLGAVIGVLLYAFRGPIADFFDMPEMADFLPILALAFPFSSLFTSTTGLFNGLRQMKTYALLITGQSGLRIILVLTLVGIGAGVKGAVTGIVLSAAAISLLGLFASRYFIRSSLEGWAQNTRRLLSFGGRMFAADATNVIANRIDIIVIGYYMAADDVGYYSAAALVATFFPLVPGAIQRITFPAASQLWAQKDYQTLGRMIDKSMKYSACVIVPLGLVVGFFAKDILTTVFGTDFDVAATPLCVLLVARVLRGGTAVPIGNVIPAIGRPDLNFKIELIGAGMNVGLNILLIPRYGILGAAIATTVSLVIGAAIFLIFVLKLLPVRIDIKWYVSAFGTALIAVLAYWGISIFVSHYVVGIVIALLYTSLVLGHFLTKEDRHMFTALAHSLIRRG